MSTHEKELIEKLSRENGQMRQALAAANRALSEVAQDPKPFHLVNDCDALHVAFELFVRSNSQQPLTGRKCAELAEQFWNDINEVSKEQQTEDLLKNGEK